MEFQKTIGSANLNNVNIVSQHISIPTLIDFKLTTPLSNGSANDGNNTLGHKGIVFGEIYKFEASMTGNSQAKKNSTELVWIIKYTSPSTSKNKTIKVQWIKKGPKFEFEVTEKYKDMCGCRIDISCHIRVKPKQIITKKLFIHNRFRYFDGHTVEFQVIQRMNHPWKINQGQSSLCGMACLYYILIQRNKSLYKEVAIELHRTGTYHFSNGYTIKPKASMYDIKPTNQDYKSMKMAEADWIVLASTRSGESNIGYDGIEKGIPDQLAAVNWMDMLVRMGKQVAGYSNVQKHDLGLVRTGFTLLTGMHSSIENLIELDKKYKSGKKILIMTDPKLIYDKRGWRNPTSIHWVVYEGGLMLLDSKGSNVTNNPIDVVSMSFSVYTWGGLKS